MRPAASPNRTGHLGSPPLLALLTALALSGCSSAFQPPTVLYLAVGVDGDQRIDTQLRQSIQERLGVLLSGFRQLHPRTSLQLGIYPEHTLLTAMQRRGSAGLDPDLLLLNGDTALQLLEAGLVDPFPASPELLRNFEPVMLERVRSRDGRLAGLPMLVQTQLSCFDRRRLPEAPRTLTDLLKLSTNGLVAGQPVDAHNLLWTAGSLDTIPALKRILQGTPQLPADRLAVERWLTWLRQTSAQQQLTYFSDQPSADAEFVAGRVAWIPCRSISLPVLRRRLGAHLGVAPLPDGPQPGRAAAVNRLRVLALGRHSSREGRARAAAFVRFSVSPLTQRSLTNGSITVLPANRYVSLPIQGSPLLEAMRTAADQGLQASSMVALIRTTDHRMSQIQSLLTQVVFGEQTPVGASGRLLQLLRPER
jgi:hypothetical protein